MLESKRPEEARGIVARGVREVRKAVAVGMERSYLRGKGGGEESVTSMSVSRALNNHGLANATESDVDDGFGVRRSLPRVNRNA